MLVVEDDVAVRRLVSRLLAALGLDVVTAANGIEALAMSRERGSAIDLIVTDVRMPGMGGPQFASHVRDNNADVAILFISGYPEDLATAEITGTPHADVLTKPFSREEFVDRVRRMLAARVSREGGARRDARLTEP